MYYLCAVHSFTTDLRVIGEQALLLKKENEALSAAVKKTPVKEVDRIVHALAEEIGQMVDCTRCGNCCKVQEPGVSRGEIERLAALRGASEKEFRDEFVAYTSEGASFLCHKPCVFLDGTVCSVYSQRPWSCADYPGLSRPNIKWRWKQVMENYGICPIVFNVVQMVKEKLEKEAELIPGSRG